MSDLIDRQKVFDKLSHTRPEVGADASKERFRFLQWFADKNAIKEVPSAREWIPCSEKLPKRIINGNVETVQEFFVTVKERWPGEEWSYHTDIAEFPGDYIDDIWQTYNDWREGQEVHVIAWMPAPNPYKEEKDE